MKTYQPKQKEVVRSWHLIDARGEILGRLATRASLILTGKNKPTYSSHLDSGDYVVVVNAEEIKLTGKKPLQKVYRSHSGYPGGFKEITFRQMKERHPERILEHAISGMLPDNHLKKVRLGRLKVVVGERNPFESKFKKA